MLEAVFALARPLLNALDPEQAHELTLRSLEAGIHPRSSAPDDGRLAASVWGLTFPNPLGIAAGFDKDARAVGPVLAMGLGFAHLTVLPWVVVGVGVLGGLVLGHHLGGKVGAWFEGGHAK